MNASEVIALRDYYKADIEIAKKRYAKLLEECTHVYDGGARAYEPTDSTYVSPVCVACGLVVPKEVSR